MSNQYTVKMETHESEIDGTFHRVVMHDGEDEVFSTTRIPTRYKLIAEMVHSTLEVAIGFGILDAYESSNTDTKTESKSSPT